MSDSIEILNGSKAFVSADDLKTVLGNKKADGILALSESFALN